MKLIILKGFFINVHKFIAGTFGIYSFMSWIKSSAKPIIETKAVDAGGRVRANLVNIFQAVFSTANRIRT